MRRLLFAFSEAVGGANLPLRFFSDEEGVLRWGDEIDAVTFFLLFFDDELSVLSI